MIVKFTFFFKYLFANMARIVVFVSMKSEMINYVPGFDEFFVAIIVFANHNPSAALAFGIVLKFEFVIVPF